ncbi:MAG: hypothetical protein DSY40_01295 [Nautilia sp.]|nr:MAG: hypothetical protein DSY40_01295 [Nautilia sp.]
MKKTIAIKEFKLANTEKGLIKVSKIEEPYGENSKPVVSIAISLNGEDVDWKAHIPYENIDELIESLKEAKKY